MPQSTQNSIFPYNILVEELGTYVGGASEEQAVENAKRCVEWLKSYRKGAKFAPMTGRTKLFSR